MSHGLIIDSKELSAGYGLALYQSGTVTLTSGAVQFTGIPGLSIPNVTAYRYEITLPFQLAKTPFVFIKNNSSTKFVGCRYYHYGSEKIIQFVCKESVTIDYMIFFPTDEYEDAAAIYGLKAWDASRRLTLDASRNNLCIRDTKSCSWVRNYSIQTYAHSLGYVPIVIGQLAIVGVAVYVSYTRWHSMEFMGVAADSSNIYLKYEQVININDGTYPLNTPLIDARTMSIVITDGS